MKKERLVRREFDRQGADKKTTWCGPFACQRVLENKGVWYNLQELAERLDVDKNGYSDIREISKFFEELGYPVTYKANASFQNLRAEFKNGNAVMVSRMSWHKGKLYEHISAVDLVERASIVLVESVGDGSLTRMQFERYDKEAFLKLWYDSLSKRCYLAVGRKPKRRR